MCELGHYTPDTLPIDAQLTWIEEAYDDNPHSLGIVASFCDGDTWQHGYYKTTKDWDDIRSDVDGWVSDRQHADRMTIHARIATHGAATVQNAHPLAIECDVCDVEYVCHNGVVNEGAKYQPLVTDGHTYQTPVDSETIAHAHGSLPETVSEVDAPDLSGKLNYVLFADNGILIRTSSRYCHTDGMIGLSTRRDGWRGSRARWTLIRADGTIDTRNVARDELSWSGRSHHSGGGRVDMSDTGADTDTRRATCAICEERTWVPNELADGRTLCQYCYQMADYTVDVDGDDDESDDGWQNCDWCQIEMKTTEGGTVDGDTVCPSCLTLAETYGPDSAQDEVSCCPYCGASSENGHYCTSCGEQIRSQKYDHRGRRRDDYYA